MLPPSPVNMKERFKNAWNASDPTYKNVGWFFLICYPLSLLDAVGCASGFHGMREFFKDRGEVCTTCMYQFHK